MGYKVIQSFNGKEALDVVENNSAVLDLVLLDMVMPGLSGYETFFRLKKIKSDIKVLIISGFALNTQVSDMLQHGACGFLQKPFEMQQLSERVAKALAG
jgi:two-component system cell cycle sensor histidine kinase/response regulator CckA